METVVNKPEIKLEEVLEKKMNWHDVVRYYNPTATDKECEFILWEETCFPFDHTITLKQIFDFFTNTLNS